MTARTLLGSSMTVVIVAACAPATAMQQASVVDPRVETAVAHGRSRVLVELRIPGGVRPEGELASAERVTAQRQAIARAQDDVLARLRGTDATLVRRFETVPLLALRIGPSALATLGTMGDVVARVVADSTSPPAGGSMPP